MFKKKENMNEPQLDTELADLMLSKVLDHCEAEPNSVPLTTLENYSNLKKERFILQKVVVVLILIGFLLLPFAFDVPRLSLTQTEESADSNQPVYEIRVSSIMKVKRVVATIDGTNLPVYETEDNVYTLEPTTNGTVTATVTLTNRQFETTTFTVGSVDMTAPTIVDHHSDAEHLYLTLADEGSGVDYEAINAVDMTGGTIEPVSYDAENNVVVFAYPTESINIYIPDKSGNTLQTIITVESAPPAEDVSADAGAETDVSADAGYVDETAYVEDAGYVEEY